MKLNLWYLLPYILPVLSYLIGKSRVKIKVPASVQKLLNDPKVLSTILKGIQAAEVTKSMTDEQKREYVRAWAKSELHGILGEWLPDSAINYLIEYVVVKQKALK